MTMSVESTPLGLKLKGHIDFDNVNEACERGLHLIQSMPEIAVDLRELERSDSSILALLTAWVRQAKAQNHTIVFNNMPKFMHDILKVYGLQEILPFE